MAKSSLQHLLTSINRQVALEQLIESLGKAKALSEISVNSQDFLSQNRDTLHHFLVALNTMLNDAQR